MRGYRLWLAIILLVAALSVWISLPGTESVDVLGFSLTTKVVQGLDLQGGSRVLLRVPPGTNFNSDTLDQAVKNVERRVNGLGVTEAVVQRQGEDRVIVELPGVKEQKIAFDAIKSTGMLEFVDFSAITSGSVPEGSCILTTDQVELARGRLLEGETLKPYDQFTCPSEDLNNPVEEPALLNNGEPFKTIMTGAGLSDAAAITQGSIGTQWVVNFAINDSGERVDDFIDYVAASANRPMAIVLDGRLLSYPTIQADLASSAGAGTMDGGIISGSFTRNDAQILAAQLKYGALPVPLEIIAFDTIGPSLGKLSVDRSIRAGIIGVLTVIAFMLIYYRAAGIAAALALLLFAAINFALFKSIPVTLSLPAITGFLISIGTAVDGNILIFERMKEELRAGRSMERAIEAGFSRAWTSIRDSNTSTIIICVILYFFGNVFGASAVQGFAITLALGLIINLFTAVIATRTFLHTLVLVVGERLRTNPRLLGV
ncbi:MAG: protein translocase subunit SecD [Chloroflexi bacterium]|nr:protein translocase subunit SecD [Chloroflexota bacterium]